MQGGWIPEKRRKSCVLVCYKNLQHMQKVGWLSTLHISSETIFHCSKLSNVDKCISREDKEIGSTTAVNPNHEQESNGLIFDFFKGVQSYLIPIIPVMGLTSGASNPEMAKKVLLPLTTK